MENTYSYKKCRRRITARPRISAQAIFTRIDEDGSGRLEAEELARYLTGMDAAVAAELRGILDSDSDG